MIFLQEFINETIRYQPQDIETLHMSRLNMLYNRHKGQRCVLVANGPSLNQMDLSFLKNEIVIGLNKIFLGFKKFSFYPRYYIAINEKVIEQSCAEINALNCVKFVAKRSEKLIPENSMTYHLETQNPPHRFCKDISFGIHEGWTVTYAALQVAYFLGFHEVVIIGMDHRYQYAGLPNETKVFEGIDINHFSVDYFTAGQHWDNPDLAGSEESYKIAKQEYEENGRCIVDATLNGSCEVFIKKSYLSIFKLSH